MLLTDQNTQDIFDTSLMVNNFTIQPDLIAIGLFMTEEGPFQANFFNNSLGKYLQRCYIKKLIFDRGAATIQNKNIHSLYRN